MKKWHILLIVVLSTLAYINIFRNTFVIDDQYFIEEWQLTRSWSSTGQMILGANPTSQQGVYRPIRSLFYLVYYQLFGTNPFFYHLHSLAVHLAATVLIFFIIREIGGRREMGLIGGLLFGLHPIHTESITYIAASMEMTGVVFFFAAFYTYLLNKKLLAVGFAILAFFTYEMTLTLPLLLALYEGILGRSGGSGRWGRYKKILPYLVGAGVFFLIRFSLGVGLSRGEYLAYSPYHTWLTMTKMIVKYVWLLVWPVTLSHNHTILPGFEAFMTPYSDQAVILRQTILDPEILLSIGVIGGIGAIGWKLRKKIPLVSFAVGWFFLSLLPVLYIFPQGTAIAEKYLYIASFGFVVLIIGLIREIGRIGPHFAKASKGLAALGVIGGILLLYGGRTYVRNIDWQSPTSLFEYETRIHPQSELSWYTLGVIYGKNGEVDKAIHAYQTALTLKPQMKEAEHNLNNLLKRQKQTP